MSRLASSPPTSPSTDQEPDRAEGDGGDHRAPVPRDDERGVVPGDAERPREQREDHRQRQPVEAEADDALDEEGCTVLDRRGGIDRRRHHPFGEHGEGIGRDDQDDRARTSARSRRR